MRDVVDAVQSGEVEFGLLPVENSLAGTVVATYDALAAGDVVVVGEVVRQIRLCLLGVPGARLEDVRTARSHPVALSQCSAFFARHPDIEAVAVYDTAGAARDAAAAGDPAHAAIAARRAADRYRLIVLEEDLQDRADNQTRFFIVTQTGKRRRVRGRGATAKTALILEADDRPGALVELLQPLADRGMNLTKLESRPGVTPWTYRFFVEFEAGNAREIRGALTAIRERARTCRVLGSFATG
jgi:prephenate dehydratase